MALRVLGRLRGRFFERIEPLAPAELDAYRKGDLLSRMVADVDALQNLTAGVEPPLVAVLAGAVSVGAAVALLPAAGLVLAAGLILGGLAVPALAGRSAPAGRRQAAARGQLSGELVELLRGAPELVAFGGEEAAFDRVRAADRTLSGSAPRRDLGGVADGLELVVTGLTVAGVLAVAVARLGVGGTRPSADCDARRCSRWPRLRPSTARLTARDLSATLAAGRRVLELTSGPPPSRFRGSDAGSRRPFAVALEGVPAR